MRSRNANVSTETIAALFQSGFVAVPQLLFKQYRRMGLSDSDLLLVLHIIAFRDGDHNEFPTFRDLSDRMSRPETDVAHHIHTLIEAGFLRIDVHTQADKGKMTESYDLTPLYYRLAQSTTNTEKNVFLTIEAEFGRPLSSVEYEQIVQWIDKDKHSDVVILAALKEAVLAGKYNFKYIDRILLDWQKHNVRTLHDVEAHKERFRRQHQNTVTSELAPTVKKRNATNNNKYDAFYQKMPVRDQR